jgi:hypothetical protein
MVGSLTTTILPDGPALRLPRLNRLTKVRKSRKVQSKEADWNDFETTIFVDQEHRFCEPDPGGGDS